MALHFLRHQIQSLSWASEAFQGLQTRCPRALFGLSSGNPTRCYSRYGSYGTRQSFPYTKQPPLGNQVCHKLLEGGRKSLCVCLIGQVSWIYTGCFFPNIPDGFHLMNTHSLVTFFSGVELKEACLVHKVACGPSSEELRREE